MRQGEMWKYSDCSGCVCSGFWLLSCAVSLSNQLSRGGVYTHQWKVVNWTVAAWSHLGKECMEPTVSRSESKPGVTLSLGGKKMLFFFIPRLCLKLPLKLSQLLGKVLCLSWTSLAAQSTDILQTLALNSWHVWQLLRSQAFIPSHLPV